MALDYKVTYGARIQYVLSPTCSGVLPAISLSCGYDEVPGEAALIRTNDDRVVCSETSDSRMVTCEFNCGNPDECKDLFVTDEPLEEDKFAQIFFSCSSDTSRGAEATLRLGVNSPGSCQPGELGVFSETFNTHIAQLGAFCTDLGIDGEFLYASQFFECGTPDQTLSGAAPIYTCDIGKNCGGLSCDVPFDDDLVITTQMHRFYDSSCVDTSGGGVFPVPEPPAPPVPEEGTYAARYRTRWTLQNLYHFSCETNLPTISFTCIGDNNEIELLQTLDDTVSCEKTGSNTLLCTETCLSCENFLTLDGEGTGSYSGAIVECSGPDLPLVKAEYLAEDLTCDSDFMDTLVVEVAHRIDMEIYCGDQFAGEYRPFDKYFDCGGGDVFRFFNTESFPEQDFVHQCSESVNFVIISSSTELTHTIPAATIFSERSIVTDDGGDCFNFVGKPTLSPSPTHTATTEPPTYTPTSNNNSPSNPPSTFETVTMPPTLSPTKHPTPLPTTLAPVPDVISSSSSPTEVPTEDEITQNPTLLPTPTTSSSSAKKAALHRCFGTPLLSISLFALGIWFF